MLKQRILTALILIPLVIAGILYLPVPAIASILALLVLQGAWEWSRLAGMHVIGMRIAYVGVLALMLWLIWQQMDNDLLMESLANSSAIFWLLATCWIFFPGLGKQKTLLNMFVKLLAGIFVLALAWFAMVTVQAAPQQGPLWILYLLFLIWIADSGAYFAGRAFGRHKLAPVVSPGKTWEGVAGALTLVFLYSLTAAYWMPITEEQVFTVILISLLLVPISVIGDLFESLMKRQSGIKDSGQLLPGHGGVMDRIDSLTAVFPVYLWMASLADLI
jgi:phosphatidate cytidylyltransferase